MSALDLVAIGTQIVLPVTLIAWLAFRPLSGGVGLLVQALATGLVLTTLLLIGVWMIPPWWTPYLYLTVWFGIVLGGSRLRLRSRKHRDRSFSSALGTLLFAVIGLLCLTLTTQAITGRWIPSGGTATAMRFPLGPGTYLVANGGANSRVNGHVMTLKPTTTRQADYRGQSYGVDLIKIDRLGLRAAGWRPERPAAYAIFGEPVFAPCSGAVIRVSDGQQDMPVPTTDTSRLEGNHVAIQCDGVIVLLAHLRQGSVRVAPGDRVASGAWIGNVGNSGQTTEPHLHIHVQRLPESGALLSGDPLFLTFDGHFPVRNERITIEGTEVSGG